MATLYESIREVEILGPQRPQLWECYVEPWLCSAIVVDDACCFSLSNGGVILVSEPQHVPKRIDGVDMAAESY